MQNPPDFIIDSLGNIHLNHHVIIHKNLLLDDINNSLLDYDIYDVKNGYLWVYLDKINIGDFNFQINLCFYQKKIWGVDIKFFHKYEKEFCWETWQKEQELNKQRQYNLWLNQLFQTKRIFAWGKIDAYYDFKGQRAGIWLSYQNQIPTS